MYSFINFFFFQRHFLQKRKELITLLPCTPSTPTPSRHTLTDTHRWQSMKTQWLLLSGKKMFLTSGFHSHFLFEESFLEKLERCHRVTYWTSFRFETGRQRLTHTKTLLLDDSDFYDSAWLLWSFYRLLFYMRKFIVYWQETSDKCMCVQWSRITL